MYKFLLIDDEILTRESILSRLPWKQLGICRVEQADDGLNALDLINDGFKPDIILTDLRMPNMNGIDLSYKLKEILPACKIIFMSGF